VHSVSPGLLQSGKTPAGVMTKAVQHAQPLLRALKAGVLAIKVGLVELLETG